MSRLLKMIQLRGWPAAFAFVAVALLLPPLTWARPIFIGSVNDEAAAEIKKFLPFANYLAKELQSEGIDQGKVVIAKNVSQMATFLREGKVDIYIDSAFPSVVAGRLSGSKFLLRRWRRGIAEYHAVIFARKDAEINSLEDLKGKIIAFEEPYSSTGYFLPKVVLTQKGFKLAPKTDVSDSVAPGEVGYVFSLDDENTMLWVLRKKVVAGAMDNQSYAKEAKGNLSSLKVLEQSFSIPRQIVNYRSDLPPKLVARIKKILITMNQSEEGKKVLKRFDNTTKFDGLTDQAMARLLNLSKHIEAELKVQ